MKSVVTLLIHAGFFFNQFLKVRDLPLCIYTVYKKRSRLVQFNISILSTSFFLKFQILIMIGYVFENAMFYWKSLNIGVFKNVRYLPFLKYGSMDPYILTVLVKRVTFISTIFSCCFFVWGVYIFGGKKLLKNENIFFKSHKDM